MQDLYRSLRTLRSHEQGIRPDPAWVSETRGRLLMQVKNTIPTKEAAEKNRRTLAIAHPGFLTHVRGPVFAVLGVLVVIFGGTFASVRAAENSLPGDSLYMVKLVTEQTQLVFERSKTEKTKLKISFTKRRIEELKKILSATEVDKKEERVSRTVEILKQDFSTLKNQLSDVQNSDDSSKHDTIEAAKAVDQEVVEAVQALKDSKKENFTEEVKQKVADAEAQVADAGMHALEVMVVAFGSENAEGQVSGDEIGASLAQHATVAQETIASILLANNGSTSSSSTSVASSTKQGAAVQVNDTSSSSTNSGTIARDAEVALDEVTALLGENRVAEAVQKLKEASAMSFLAQTEAQKELIASLLVESEEGTEDVEVTSSTESATPSTSSTSP